MSLSLEDLLARPTVAPTKDYKDDAVGCHDYNVMGENCPFYSGGECKILGWSKHDPVPEDRICDKTPGPITTSTIVRFDLEEEYAKELQKLHKSDGYKRWAEAWDHYQLPLEVRRQAEEDLLFKQMGYKANISKREFKKKFKPNNIGVTEKEPPTFRQRVLEVLRLKSNWWATRRTGSVEKVALVADLVNDRYVNGTNEVSDEWWDINYLTRHTFFEEEMGNGGIECFESTDLLKILTEHQGKKILIEWKWWYSGGSYYNPDDVDYGAEYVKLLKVLDG